jgi:hypothetical protein
MHSLHKISSALIVGLLISASAFGAEELQPSPWFGEQIATLAVEPDVRIHVNAPTADPADATRPTRVIVFALPNGNTLEQTLGCKLAEGMDWHYNIQHVAAQVRLLRTLLPDERIVLVCAEAKGLSWPTWRASHPDANQTIARLLEDWRVGYGGPNARLTLTGHSGGGSFKFGVIEAGDEIPATIDRIAFLDSNYNFDAAQHAAKFTRWLRGDAARRLVVIAYDDREIKLDGKKVVGPTGGTFRATNRMIEALGMGDPVQYLVTPPFNEKANLNGRARFYVHPNPDNKILHTALVGDMNGLVHALTLGTSAEGTWGTFGGPRAYTEWIQPDPTRSDSSPQSAGERQGEGTLRLAVEGLDAPQRPADAPTGSEFAEQVAALDLDAREAAIFAEVSRGNFPEFERRFLEVPIAATLADGTQIAGTLEVMPDCLSVGSDDDFLRMPMRPQTAQRIADLFGCIIPTRKMVDAIDAAATVRLTPAPLTEDRESVAVFVLSNDKIEAQRAGRPLGELVTGAKKDVVLTPRVFERPQRLAIYGWRQPDGSVIQPLTIVHWDRYVDYSHGVRLVRDTVLLDGERVPINELLVEPVRCVLVSDEGVIDPPRYPEDGDE